MNIPMVNTMWIICKDYCSMFYIVDKFKETYDIYSVHKHGDRFCIRTKNNEWISIIKSNMLSQAPHFYGLSTQLCFIQKECYSKELFDICTGYIRNIIPMSWIEPQVFTVPDNIYKDRM